MTDYNILGASVQRPDKRFGMNSDKPDAYLALTLSVGKNAKYTEIVLSKDKALLLAGQLIAALRHIGVEE